jgi:hypothetical protein
VVASPQSLEFEVAAVRQNKSGPPEQPRFPGDGQGALLPGGQLTMRNQVLKTLLGFAFNPGNQRFRDDLDDLFVGRALLGGFGPLRRRGQGSAQRAATRVLLFRLLLSG